MINVQCPSCSAPYELDERRLPPGGLNMRCPKCGKSFPVSPAGGPAAADGQPSGSDSEIPLGDDDLQSVPPSGPAASAGAASAGGGTPQRPPIAPPFDPGSGGGPKPASGAGGKGHGIPAPKSPPARPAAGGGGLDDLELDDLDLPAPKPAAGGARSPAQPSGGDEADELDLPAVKQTGGDADIEMDLPAPKGAAGRPATPATEPVDELDLPAPRQSGAGGLDELDLPAPKRASSGGDLELDLPAPKGASGGGGSAAGADELDLPAPKQSAGGGDLELDLDLELPAPKAQRPDPDTTNTSSGGAASSAFGAAVLGGLDGFASGSASDGAPQGTPLDDLDADLPVPKAGEAAPPGVADELDLPQAKDGIDLPGASELDVPVARGGQDLPAPKQGASADGELDLPPPAQGEELPSFGDLDLSDVEQTANAPRTSQAAFDAPGGEADDELPLPDDDLPLPEPEGTAPASADAPSAAGGTAFGELELADEGGDELEFDEIPEEAPPASSGPSASAAAAESGLDVDEPAAPGRSAQPAAERTRAQPPAETQRAPRGGRTVLTVAAVLLVLAAAGAALHFTPYGTFGIYALERFLPSAGDPAQIERAIERVEELAAADDYGSVRESLSVLADARHDAGLNRRLLARSLVHESLYQVRFGEDSQSAGRATRIAARLEKRSWDAPGAELARAADALRRGRVGEAKRHLGRARGTSSRDPYYHLIAGELALTEEDPVAANKAFEQAVEHGGGARAQWGRARASIAAAQHEAADEALEATLAQSPRHAEARLMKARRLHRAGGSEQAIALLRQVVGAEPVEGRRLEVTDGVRASAFTLLGRIHEERGRRGQAREAYDQALELDASRLEALLGSGRVLLGERLFREALARFEVIIEGEAHASRARDAGERERPPQVQAKLGATRAMLSLDRGQQARAMLQRLAQERPEDAKVARLLGEAEKALGDAEAAQTHFREAIRLEPDSFDAYMGLAQLYFDEDEPAKAAEVLERARAQVAETAEVRRMLGESALARNELDDAIAHFRGALELDGADLAALFGLGVTLRQSGRLGDAKRVLERLSDKDPSYPGLAVERGRIYEAEGEPARAVEAYERALEQRPDELDLMLRLGVAQLAADRLDAAEQTLQKVLEQRRNSAEAQHFVGRVAFARNDTRQALEHFDRAVQLDPTRGEYHLYVAWAKLEAGKLSSALEAVRRAIEHEPTLGDAHWIRGRLRLRSGAVRDALEDLQRALELNPSRFDAYASVGDCHDQLGSRRKAIEAYEKAVANDGARGEWWYALGRLRLDADDPVKGRQALKRAIEAGRAEPEPPRWLADAHRLAGDAARLRRHRREAVSHYERYLELAPDTAIDREDVTRRLRELR